MNFKLILAPQLWCTTQRLYLNFQPKRPARDRAQWPQSSENWSQRPKFQSCSNQLKLSIPSLLILLITKIPGLSILSQNCGSLCSNSASILHHENFDAPLLHKCPYFWLKFGNIGIFLSGGSGGFRYSISADLNNLKILASEADFQNFEAIALCPWQA